MTVVCPECGDSRVVTARSARRIRAGQGDLRCRICRSATRIEVTELHRAWAIDAWRTWTDGERAAVAFAFLDEWRTDETE